MGSAMSVAAISDAMDAGFLASIHRARLKPVERAKASSATNYPIVDFDSSEATALNNAGLHRTIVILPKIDRVPMAFDAGRSSVSQKLEKLFQATVIRNVTIESSGIIGPTQRAAQSAKHKIAIKLTELGSLFFEDYERTLKGLTAFLSVLHNPEVPSLAAESSGAIVATWRKGDRYASLRFLDETQFHYALAIKTPRGITRPWGTSDRSAFFSKQPHARELIEQDT